MEGSLRQAPAAPKPVEALQETGVRQRELSANVSVPNPKMASSVTRILEGSPEHNTDTKDAMAEAAIAAAALAYAQSSAAAFANFSHGSTYNQPMKDHPTVELGHWGWNGSSEPYEQSMSPGLPPGYSGASHPGRSFVPQGVAAQTNGSINAYGVGAIPPSTSSNGWANVNKKVVYDVKSPYGPGYLEEDWEELSPPSQTAAYAFTTRKVVKLDERGFPISSSETINTVTPQNKVGNLPVSVNFRLASPTPSEEDDEPEKQNTNTSAAAVANGNTQSAQNILHLLPKPPGTMPAVTAPFYKTLNTHVDETGRVHYASAPLVTPASVDQDFSLNFEQPKNQPVSGPLPSNLRSRDPRRQLQNGYTEAEVPLHHSTGQAKYPWPPAVQTVDKKREGEDYASYAEPSKRLKISGSSDEMQNMDSSVGTFAMGGWLEEGAVMSPGHENNGVQAMDIDLDSPTPPDRKQNSKDELVGINMKKIEIPSGKGPSETVGSGVAANVRNKLSPDVFNYNSMKPEPPATEEVLGKPSIFYPCRKSGFLYKSLKRCLMSWPVVFIQKEQDVGRHRMRPRDPRRVLLESSAEAVQANHRSAQANEATDSGPTPQYRQRSSPPPNAPLTLRQLSANSLGNTHDQREGRPTPDEMNQTINTSLSSKQLSTGQEIAALKEETLFDERNKERGREPTQNPVSEARDVSSEEATREETSDHLDPWDALLRKPRFGPSHWGGSDMHRDFEQLLEDLDEVQRVSIQNERKRRMQEQDRMFSAGKLCLVLDLDHTLLNSAKVNIIACGATPNSSSDPEYRLTLKLFLMKICTWLYFIVD
jgi:RNA polymerase II C-terminal domain phosphatase-like 3/4